MENISAVTQLAETMLVPDAVYHIIHIRPIHRESYNGYANYMIVYC